VSESNSQIWLRELYGANMSETMIDGIQRLIRHFGEVGRADYLDMVL
jgi:hypothetical protein